MVRLQKAWRRRRLHKKIMHEINRKIAFQRQERYRKEMERQQSEQTAAAADKTSSSENRLQESGDGVQHQPLPSVSVAPLQDVGEHLVSSSMLPPLASTALNTSKGFHNALDTSKTGLHPQLSP